MLTDDGRSVLLNAWVEETTARVAYIIEGFVSVTDKSS